MKHFIRILILTVGVNPGLSDSVRAQQVVTLTGDPWPPYVVGELGGNASGGMGIELLEAIFDRLDGVEVRFLLIPWKRALREVEKGTMDGIFMLLKKPEREQYMEYTDPLFTSYNLIWYCTGRFPDGFAWNRLEDLTPYSIGVTRGYSYGDAIDQAIEAGSLRVTEAPSVEQLFAMLAGKRVDLVLSNDAVGHALAKEHNHVAQIVAASKATGEDVHYLAFSKKSPARGLIVAINSILGELRDEGVIESIIRGNGNRISRYRQAH